MTTPACEDCKHHKWQWVQGRHDLRCTRAIEYRATGPRCNVSVVGERQELALPLEPHRLTPRCGKSAIHFESAT